MRVAIAGAGSVGTAIASDLHANGHDVLVIERDPDLIDRIRQATINADFDAVLELADEIARSDQRLATALRGLAERFASERILATLPGGGGS